MRMAKSAPFHNAGDQPAPPRSVPVHRALACGFSRRLMAARSLNTMSLSALIGWWFSITSTLATSCGAMLLVACP